MNRTRKGQALRTNLRKFSIRKLPTQCMTVSFLFSSTGSEDEGTDADEKMDISTISTDTRDFEGICKSCNGDANKNKDGRPEILIHCAKCESASKPRLTFVCNDSSNHIALLILLDHPTCLELSVDMVPYIKKYNWQCTDCKNCIECNDPGKFINRFFQ